jgi:serine O-acetyltransferase
MPPCGDDQQDTTADVVTELGIWSRGQPGFVVGTGEAGMKLAGHPGAKIGRNFFIDHGFTVIGETAEIGDNVTIYQCVTLGGTNPTDGKGGKRHPTLEDDVIIGSGAQIIGPITVGRRARVGANAVVTDDVPEGATMIGLKARSTLVPAETWLKEFIPYGTPCDEPCEPDTRRIEELESRLAQLADELAKLRAASLADGDGEPLPAPDERQRSGTGS